MNHTEPFNFHTERRLVQLTGQSARTLPELLEILREISGSSIFYHTHHLFLSHHFEKPIVYNGFASWVSGALQEDALGERLSAIDLMAFTSIRQLREEIISKIETHIKMSRGRRPRECPPGDEFHFCKSKSFIMATGIVAEDVPDFFEKVQTTSNVSLYFHFLEARLRLGRPTNDFSQWFRARGEKKLADAIDHLDPYVVTLDELKEQIVGLGKNMDSTRTGIRLSDYEEIIGTDVMDELRVVADRVKGRHLQNINSTAVGGGVAEILTRMVPLLRELGVTTTWDIMKGDEAFFNVTKAFHNALHGKPETITEEMLQCYRDTTEANLKELEITGDVVLIHDPQPAGLIARKKDVGRGWVWRCHIDVSTPDPLVWNFLSPYVDQYDASIYSMPDFAQRNSIPQFMIAPSIDPLSDKNRELEQSYVDSVIAKYDLNPERPIMTQISRFDRLKDPLGVIGAYKLVKKRHDCQLVLAGGGAPDDPEGAEVLREVQEAAGADPDVHVLLLPPFSDLEINALVRGSTIIFQKSIKEGFGLTVSEALWKRKPVIGGAVGGIKLQIVNGVTGFLVHSPEGAAHRAAQLLMDPSLCKRLGENGQLHVKQNFLLTRHVKDYMLVMLALDHPDEDVVHLS